MIQNFSLLLFFYDLFLYQKFLKCPIRMHLLYYITTSNKLSFDINLRYSWPIWKQFDPFPYFCILQNIDIFKIMNFIKSKDLYNIIWKSTFWLYLISFHKNANFVTFNPLFYLIIYLICFWTKVIMRFEIRFIRKRFCRLKY